MTALFLVVSLSYAALACVAYKDQTWPGRRLSIATYIFGSVCWSAIAVGHMT